MLGVFEETMPWCKLIVIAAALVAAGCASSAGGDIREGARAACVAQETPAAEMGRCIDTMAATIRAARAEARARPAPSPDQP